MGVGARRATIQHPGLELVGLVVHSEGKEGRDAGDLCGLPLTGVIATRDIDRALSIDADVVAYFATGDYRYREAVDDVVTTSLVPFCYPPAAEPDLRELLEAACREGGTTLFNSGVEPGWINDLVPLGVQRHMRAHRLHHDAGDPRLRADRAARQPVPRDGRLEDDIAPVVGFLLSDASACVTGQTLMPDGSRVMLR